MSKPIQLSLLGLLLIPCWIIAAKYDIDLVNLYAAQGFAQSDPSRIYAYNGDLGRYFYGPFSLVVFGPLAWLDFGTVKAIWIGLQTLSYLGFWYLLYRLYPALLDRKAWLGWLAVFILAINPIHNNFQSNNIQLMLGVMILFAEWWSGSHSSKKQFLAGAVLSFAAAIKVFPLFICAFYLLTKPTRVRQGVLAGGLFTLLVPIIPFGFFTSVVLFQDFVANLGTYNVENSFTRVPDILCLPSLLARVFSGLSPQALSLVTRGAILAVSGAFFLWVLQLRKLSEWNSSRLGIHVWALALTLMTFLNPSTRPHYFLFYIPAVASLAEMALSLSSIYRRWVLGFLTMGILFIAFTAQGVTGKDLNDWLEATNFPTYGAAFLAIGMIVALRSPIYRRLR